MEIYITITKTKLGTFTSVSVILAFVTLVNGCSKVITETGTDVEKDNYEDEYEYEYEYEDEIGKHISL